LDLVALLAFVALMVSFRISLFSGHLVIGVLVSLIAAIAGVRLRFLGRRNGTRRT
jgi:hypothetical protein